MTAHLTVSVPEDGSAAAVSGSLRVGTLTFVELGDGETLTASGGGQTATLKRGRFGGSTSYSARLDGVTKPGTEIVFALQRGGEDDSAPRSTVRLPDAVKLTAPTPGARFSRTRDDITVRLAGPPSRSPAIVTWTGQCVAAGSIELAPGQTEATISRDTIKPAPQPSPSPSPSTRTPATTTCQVTVTVTRRSTGELDPAFKDGSVHAESQATRPLTSAP